jgi:hypothetical protein
MFHPPKKVSVHFQGIFKEISSSEFTSVQKAKETVKSNYHSRILCDLEDIHLYADNTHVLNDGQIREIIAGRGDIGFTVTISPGLLVSILSSKCSI